MKSLLEYTKKSDKDLPDIYCDLDQVLVAFMKGAEDAIGADFKSVAAEMPSGANPPGARATLFAFTRCNLLFLSQTSRFYFHFLRPRPQCVCFLGFFLFAIPVLIFLFTLRVPSK